MQVRLLKHHGGWKPGRVFAEMPDGVANLLIRRGVAELADDEAEAQAKPKTREAKPRKR